MPEESSLNSLSTSLNKLSDFASHRSSGSGSTAKVKRKNKGKNQSSWKSDESTDNLLSGIISDIEEEASAEEARKERERIAKEEAKKAEEELLEIQKRAEAEAQLMEEAIKLQQTQERRTIQLAAITRQKKIEAGEIDLEEEARQKREEEARIQRKKDEEEARKNELSEAQKLIEQQDEHLKELALKPLEEAMQQKKSNAGKIFLIAFALIALVAAYGFIDIKFIQKGPVYNWYEPDADVYAMQENYPITNVTFEATKVDLLAIDQKLVDQGIVETPKRTGGGGGGRKTSTPAATTTTTTKTSTLGGRGSLGF